MPFRLLVATPLGLTVTLALVLVMQTLIDTGLNPLSERISPRLPVWIAEPVVDTPPVDDLPLTRPSPAPIPPADTPYELRRTRRNRSHTIDPNAVGQLNEPVFDISPLANGALVQITTAQPVYPARALQQRLEGYVTVRFDVNAKGQTENLQVTDASHAVFERPAIRAASKLRFKPTVVDGRPQTTHGMVYRFRFELED